MFNKKSITDILRKYVGVVLAAVFASAIIEFLLFRAGSPPWTIEAYSQNMKDVSDSLNITTVPEAMNASAKGGISGLADMNQTLSTTVVQPAATATPAPVPLPLIHESGAVSRGAPDMFTNIADAVTAHPGLMFLLGCVFVIVLLAIWDYHKRRKNGCPPYL